MYLYVIRHGQSEANIRGEYGGWEQVSLTEKGIEDAKNAGRLLHGITFDKVYASDLRRAIQTCENALPGVAYQQEPLLRELYTGSLEGMRVADAQKKYGDVHELARRITDFTPFGGETRQMELDRTQKFMHRMEVCSENENVAAFCHAGTVCCILQLALGVAFSYEHLATDNGAVSVFSYNGSIWRLIKWNIT